MDRWRRLVTAIRGWFSPGSLDAELAEELQFHIDRQIEANLAAGMDPARARRAARLLLGGPQGIREESRDGRHGALLHQFVRDVAYGIRLLRRTPGFALTACAIVALGIGAATAIVSVVYGVLVRPLPFSEPDRLVTIFTHRPQAEGRDLLNPADQRELGRHAGAVLDDVALVWRLQNYNLTGSGEPERLFAARVSSNLFAVLGVSPAIGRSFTEEEDEIGQERVVLISDGLWRRRFGGDPSVVGRTIMLSGTPFQVIGVMGPEFQFPEREHQLWVPLTINPRQLTRQVGGFDHFAVARLAGGVTRLQAQAALDTIAARLAAAHPATHRGVRLELAPLLDEVRRPVRPTLYVLLAGVGCLLAIACLNLANLLGTRAAVRTRELSIRLALGASRRRLVLQSLAEITPVLVLGGAAGVAAAWTAIGAFVPMAPAALPRVEAIGIDGAVLAISIALLAWTGVCSAVLPAWYASRSRAYAAQERSSTGTREGVRIRSVLVIAQVALALPLLAGAAVLVRSFSALMDVDPGFSADRVLSLHLAISRVTYTDDARVAAYIGQIVERVRAVPGVAAAAMVNRLPLSGNNQTRTVTFELASGAPRQAVTVQSRAATPGYFETMRIPVIAGRDFSSADTASAPLVGIIDERLASTLWPGQPAVGRRFEVALPGAAPAWGQVVGVVGNVRHEGLDSGGDRQIYFGHQQFADGRAVLVLRTDSDARRFVPAVVQALRDVDPEQAVYDVRLVEDVLARSAAGRWLNMVVVTTFASSALALAGVGLYGVMAYGVTQRMREFGVRLALGAQRRDVTRMVLRQGTVLVAWSLPLGLAGAAVLTRALRTQLFNVAPLDPAAFAAAVLLLSLVAMLASYVPARRAARSDPTVALRAD